MTSDPDCIHLDNYGVCIINFRHIFNKCYKDIVSDLFDYDIYHDVNARRIDTRRIYYYHLIKGVCDHVLSIKTNNKVIIYYSSKDIQCDFKQCQNKKRRVTREHATNSDFTLFITRFFKQLKGLLPVRVYVSDVKFSTFIQYFNNNKGKYIEALNKMRSTKANKKFDFERVKKFSEKYNLTYLTNDYFNQVKVKCIMYK